MVSFPRLDDVTSFLTGLGTSVDRSTSMRMLPRAPLTMPELDAFWTQKGISVLCSTLPAEAMTREGHTIESLPEWVDAKAVDSTAQDLAIKRNTARLAAFGSHWGGAILGVALDDGLPPYWPLDLGRIKRVRGFFVLNRNEVQPVTRANGEPEAYLITAATGTPIEGRLIHASRVIKYCGPIDLPEHMRRDEQYWSLSVLERVYDEMRKMWSALGYAEGVLHDLILDVFSIPGLQEAVMAGKGDMVKARVRLFAGLKSIFRALVIDGGNEEKKRAPEQYVQKSRTVTGIPQLVDVFVPAAVAATGIPRTIFLGDSYGGLNSGGNDGEWRSWDARVKSWQGDIITTWLTWMYGLLFAAKDGPTAGREPETFTIKHRPLRQPTPKEEAEIDALRAERHRTYWEMGVLSAAVIQEQVFVQGRDRISMEAVDLPALPPAVESEVNAALTA